MNNTRTRIPAIILAIAAILMVVSFFLPYMSLGNEELIGEYGSMSLIDIAKVLMEIPGGLGIVFVAILFIIGLFTLLVLLFALIRKPIPAIVFVILATAVYWVLGTYNEKIEIVQSLNIHGTGYYLFYISALLVFVSSIWFLAVRKNKTPQPTYVNDSSNMQS